MEENKNSPGSIQQNAQEKAVANSSENSQEVSKIINIKTFRVVKEQKKTQWAYALLLKKLDKTRLLEELLDYHETYKKSPLDMNTTIRAQLLMEELEARAHLSELKELSAELNAKLKARLYEQMQAGVK